MDSKHFYQIDEIQDCVKLTIFLITSQINVFIVSTITLSILKDKKHKYGDGSSSLLSPCKFASLTFNTRFYFFFLFFPSLSPQLEIIFPFFRVST